MHEDVPKSKSAVLSIALADYLAQLIQNQVYPGLFRRVILDFLAAGDATISR